MMVPPERIELSTSPFIPTTAFAIPYATFAAIRVCGLDHPLTLSRHHDLGPARLASTPSLSGLARDRHGLTALGFPDFERFAPARFRVGRQSFTKGALYP